MEVLSTLQNEKWLLATFLFVAHVNVVGGHIIQLLLLFSPFVDVDLGQVILSARPPPPHQQ